MTHLPGVFIADNKAELARQSTNQIDFLTPQYKDICQAVIAVILYPQSTPLHFCLVLTFTLEQKKFFAA